MTLETDVGTTGGQGGRGSGGDPPTINIFDPFSTFFQDLLSQKPSHGRKIAKFGLGPPYRR